VTSPDRYLCPTLHAEQLEHEQVWALVQELLVASGWRWTLFVEPLGARIAGIDLTPQLQWLVDNGHEIALHIHYRALHGDPGQPTGYHKGGEVGVGDVHRCLEEGFDYVCARAPQPVGFVAGAWNIVDAAYSWLEVNGFQYDSSRRTYHAAGPGSRLVPDEVCSTTGRIGSLVEVPTTASLSQQLRRGLRPVRTPAVKSAVEYDLFYLHDYDLFRRRPRVAARAVLSLLRHARSLPVRELVRHLEPS
jgi:hypothetical protein